MDMKQNGLIDTVRDAIDEYRGNFPGGNGARVAVLAVADWFDSLEGSSTDRDMWACAADRLRDEGQA